MNEKIISEKVKKVWNEMTVQEQKFIPVLFPMSTMGFSHEEICELMNLREEKLGKSPL